MSVKYNLLPLYKGTAAYFILNEALCDLLHHHLLMSFQVSFGCHFGSHFGAILKKAPKSGFGAKYAIYF